MNQKQKLDRVRELVEPTYRRLHNWGHGWQHVLNVLEWSEKIARAESEDPFLYQVAAYCHDLGRLEEEEKGQVNPVAGAPSSHGDFSVKPTQIILDQIGIKGKDRADILEAVKLHVIRKYEGPNKILSVLQDADRADGFSKFAVLRFAVFNCEMPIAKPNDKKDIDILFEKVGKELKKNKQYRQKMLHTLNYVFGWYDTLLNTRSAKTLLAPSYRFLKEFYEEISP